MIGDVQQIGIHADDNVPSGVVIDGAVYPLAGQPPIATSHGWGNMGWLLFSR